MIPLLESNKSSIAEICRRHGVARLDVFGSAAGKDFDPARSDVDLLVEFAPGKDLGPWMSEFFELKEELEALLGREIELIMAGEFRNPYFARDVQRTRRLLHAA